jgi:hypothetical protein
MTEPTTPAPPAQGLLARAIGMFTAPRQTFEGVVRTPKAVGMLFLVVVIMALATAGPQFTERGRQAALDNQVQTIEKFTGQPVTDEVYAQMEGRSKYTAPITLVSFFITMPIGALLFGAIYWAIFNALLGGTASFKQVLAIVTHSMIIGAVGMALGAPIQYAKGTMSSTGPFNLGVLVPMLDEKSFAANFLGFINPFQVWGTIVTAIGLAVLYKRKSTNIAIALLLVYALIAGGVAAWLSR